MFSWLRAWFKPSGSVEMDVEVRSRKYVGGVWDVVWMPGVDILEPDEMLGM